MERVRKTFFDPLAVSKTRIRQILDNLPEGSAHPYSPEKVLLCRTARGIEEIDISTYREDFFFNAVDLGEMGEMLLRRMAGFKDDLSVFDDFQVAQAPASTFEVPIVTRAITIFAVSERMPTYYDFCLADADGKASCYIATRTFTGVNHSGDINDGQNLLQHVRLDLQSLTEKELCVFISGYKKTPITKFLGTSPALLVANHIDKVLYIIPVPLDQATIGDATLCCPLVIKRNGDSLVCSILPKATTDRGKMCNSGTLRSPCFQEAMTCADFITSAPQYTGARVPLESSKSLDTVFLGLDTIHSIPVKENAVFVTSSIKYPSFLNLENEQVICFGTGLDFKQPGTELQTEYQPPSVLLPCIFGSQLQGPILLATGTVPSNVPFLEQDDLLQYLDKLKSVIVIVDEGMTDNARNLAGSYRINALFIVQLNPLMKPNNTGEVLELLDSANINAVTALAGPQSLIIVQIFDKYYFYRGLANQKHLQTSTLAFGSEVTSIIETVDLEHILDPRIRRVISLDDENAIILPTSGHLVQPRHFDKLFEELSIDQIQDLQDDISAAVPQLQAILSQKDLQELSKALVLTLSRKISSITNPMCKMYLDFMSNKYRMGQNELEKERSQLSGRLRKNTKELQKVLEPIISSLANMMSSQTTSKRTHDLKRMVRQAQIQSNVEAAKNMTFETLAGYLETHAEEMGVMLLNIDAASYEQLLTNLKCATIDASPCCDFDSRILYLPGLDAGIIMEQSQGSHAGPLQSQAGPSHPILALPYLNQGLPTGSMIAWVCWDEFVNLQSPYTVRWMDKCNEPHIAALRILMRDTLSQAVVSREHNIQPGSPDTGRLMGAMLMTAMSKLAALRTTAPVVLNKAEDSVTKLMRGLFGNLLTTAGSGVRPLSMVWQLFGATPQYDVPTTHAEWFWYETVVALYPYTGWPLEKFYENVENLLDKALVRVVTKNENVAEFKASLAKDMATYCKLRNIQLEHSRTIITIFMRMLTAEDIDMAAVAARLLDQLPQKLVTQTNGYTRMMRYLAHLAQGGQQRAHDNLVTASIYTRRSAAFAEIKIQVSRACKNNNWAMVKESCQVLMNKHEATAALWHVSPESLKFQNMKVYRDLLAADLGQDSDQSIKAKNRALIEQVLSDAEKERVPWQVGKEGQFGESIEPLNESFLQEMLTGEKSELSTTNLDQNYMVTTTVVKKEPEDKWAPFRSSLKPEFVIALQKELSAENVCDMINIPPATMNVFTKALNPDFVWQDLGENFKDVVMEMLKNRSNRSPGNSIKRLLNMKGRRQIFITG